MKKKFRIGVAAKTVDGRDIKPEWLTSAGKTYDPAVYGARINVEHIRGVLKNSEFNAMGDVLSVEVKEETIGGEKRTALYAELDPTSELIELSKSRQKVYTSMELQPNFPNEGDWYLVGLAITDSPASMGTEMLSFKAGKQPDSYITELAEIELSFVEDEETDTPDTKTLLSRIGDIFSVFKKSTDEKTADLGEAVELLATEVSGVIKDLDDGYSAKIKELTEALEKSASDYSAATETLEKLTATVADIEKALEGQERFGTRPPATGGDTDQKIDY